MPTYQYACTECAERLEVVQRFSDDPLTDCPVCAGRLRKVFSAVGVVFKGSGFYRTDSRAAVAASNGQGEGKNEGKRDGAGEGADKRDGTGERTGESAGAKPAKGSGSSGEATGNGSKPPASRPAPSKASAGGSKTAGSAA